MAEWADGSVLGGVGTPIKVGGLTRQSRSWAVWTKTGRFAAVLTSDALRLYRVRGTGQVRDTEDYGRLLLEDHPVNKWYRLAASSVCEGVPGNARKFTLRATRQRAGNNQVPETATFTAPSDVDCSMWIIALTFRIQALSHEREAVNEAPELTRNPASTLASQYDVPVANIRALVNMGFSAPLVRSDSDLTCCTTRTSSSSLPV